jgi:hypothetical protein
MCYGTILPRMRKIKKNIRMLGLYQDLNLGPGYQMWVVESHIVNYHIHSSITSLL